MPRASLVRLLDRPGALETEIARWIVARAEERARDLLMSGAPAPSESDLYARAIAGVYHRIRSQSEAARLAREHAEAIATDDTLRRIRAGEELS